MVKHELIFGIPTTRSLKSEKYPDTPVLTLLEVGDVKGANRKMELNTKAVELFGFAQEEDVYVSFAFLEDGSTIFADVTELDNVKGLKLTKSATFTSKQMYEYLCEKFGFDKKKGGELLLSDYSNSMCKVGALTTSVERESTESNVAEEANNTPVEIPEETDVLEEVQ